MPFVLRPFTVSKPTSHFLCWSTLQGPLRYHTVQGASSPIGHSPNRYPFSTKQLEKKTEEFIDSINKEAVCLLASQLNDDVPCVISDMEHGSFNICFLVNFDDDATWVVRVPINPVVFDPWTKIQSEVATMIYLEEKTSVPVPHIWSYGTDAKLGHSDSVTMSFMMYEYVAGHPLTTRRLERSGKEKRLQFFTELIDILMELRRLEFPSAGSLMPNPDNDLEPFVGDLLTMASNELRINGLHPSGRRKVFTTEESFLKYQYHLLSETCRLPCECLDEVQAKEEIFALHSLAEELPKLVEPHFKYGPFVLSHPDLRCSNIIVDEDLHILAVIDWEFANTVPVLYATPPAWITGHGRSGLAILQKDVIRKDFYHALESRALQSWEYTKLKHDWSYRSSLYFPIVQILRFPDSLLEVYYPFLFRKFFDGDCLHTIHDLFKRKGKRELQEEVDIRVEESKRYQQHLIDRGLLHLDEDEERQREIIATF